MSGRGVRLHSQGSIMTKYTSKPWSVGILIAVAVAIWPLARAYGDDDEKGGDGRAYAIGLWGDLPYSDVQASVGVPNLIADMNAQELALRPHTQPFAPRRSRARCACHGASGIMTLVVFLK
jgi:hypothetical protein